MALLSQLSGCTLVRVEEDVLILRICTAQVTAAGGPSTQIAWVPPTTCYVRQLHAFNPLALSLNYIERRSISRP